MSMHCGDWLRLDLEDAIFAAKTIGAIVRCIVRTRGTTVDKEAISMLSGVDFDPAFPKLRILRPLHSLRRARDIPIVPGTDYQHLSNVWCSKSESNLTSC